MPAVEEGQSVFVLRDLEELTEKPLALSAGGMMLVSLLDGKRTAAQLRDLFLKNTGAVIELPVILELVKALEVFDAVSSGVVDMYHSAEYYWERHSPAFSFFCAVPFGFTADEMAAWIHFGGGQELWDELSANYNIKPLLCGTTGAQMGG